LIEADPAEIGTQPDAKATSSTASTSDQGGDSLLDSVQAALKDGSEPEKSPASEQGSAKSAETQSDADPAKAGAAEDPLEEISEEELKRYGPKTQRRIRQLLGQRAEANSEIEKLRPKAAGYDQIEQFAKANRLSNDDLAVGYELMALTRNDPFKAWDRIQPIYAQLAEIVGHTLPKDVQERVNLGYLSAEDARQLVQSQRRADLAEGRAREQGESQQREQEAGRLRAHVDACRTTANEWESAKRGADPDWSEKQARIGELIELEVRRNGYPPTQAEVVKMLDGFLARVNKDFARFKPPVRAVTPVRGGASSDAKAEPQTLQEAVDMALAQ